MPKDESAGGETIVGRPSMVLSPGNGVLRNEHFQVAYVTRDLDRACAIFGKRYGVGEWLHHQGVPRPGIDRLRIALAWAGGTMLELLEVEGSGAAFYNDRLPVNEFAIRHHHFGYFVRSKEAWQGLEREIEQGGWKVVSKSHREGFMSVCYIEAPELDHYLEYIHPEAGGLEFFKRVPGN